MSYFHILDPEGNASLRQTYCGLISTYDSYAFVDRWMGSNSRCVCQACIYLEEKAMPKKDSTNSQDKLLEMETIDTTSVVKAIQKGIPQPYQQSRLMARIVAEEKRKDAKAESARNLAYWLEDYKGRRVEIPSLSVDGIMTDARSLQLVDNRIAIVVDGHVYEMSGETSGYVYPREHESCAEVPHWDSSGQPANDAARRMDEAAKETTYEQRCQAAFNRKFKPTLQCCKPSLHIGLCAFEREDGVMCFLEDDRTLVPFNQGLRRQEKRAREVETTLDKQKLAEPKYYPGQDTNSFVHGDVKMLAENRAQYRDYMIEVAGVSGIYSDIYGMPHSQNWFYVVIDGRIHALGGSTALKIHMPRKPVEPEPVKLPRMFFKISMESLFHGRRGYYGKAIKYEPHLEEIGTFTAMTEGRRKSYIVVADGNIIHFANDAHVWVEL